MTTSNYYSNSRTQDKIFATNNVIKNTYMLLSASILFSAFTAFIGMGLNLNLGLLVLPIYIGLLFLIQANKTSGLGIVFVFMLTGFMGLTLGPLLNSVLSLKNGGQIVSTALGTTGLIFLTLSGYAMYTRQRFNFMAGFLMSFGLVVFFATLLGGIFAMPMLYIFGISGFALLSAGTILYETSNMIHGDQVNYIDATVNLYIALYNLFVSLLQILSLLSGRDER